jgi:hypothetical protein
MGRKVHRRRLIPEVSWRVSIRNGAEDNRGHAGMRHAQYSAVDLGGRLRRVGRLVCTSGENQVSTIGSAVETNFIWRYSRVATDTLGASAVGLH